ncbi:MAG: hypothetical protein KDD66_12340 [Bdellovibrionales bacterium]|nr:hypothetical protein [Bdellovibrionales bacterium]
MHVSRARARAREAVVRVGSEIEEKAARANHVISSVTNTTRGSRDFDGILFLDASDSCPFRCECDRDNDSPTTVFAESEAVKVQASAVPVNHVDRDERKKGFVPFQQATALQ